MSAACAGLGPKKRTGPTSEITVSASRRHNWSSSILWRLAGQIIIPTEIAGKQLVGSAPSLCSSSIRRRISRRLLLKKLAGSSAPAKPRRMKGKPMKKATSKSLTSSQVSELAALATLPDDQIDMRDSPEQRDWSGARRGVFFRPVKQQLTLRIDSDVVGWFKGLTTDGLGYQTSINRALREYAVQHGHASTSKSEQIDSSTGVSHSRHLVPDDDVRKSRVNLPTRMAERSASLSSFKPATSGTGTAAPADAGTPQRKVK